MPLTLTRMTRVFRFGSLSLPDPDPSKTPAQIMEHYAVLHPSLTNGSVKGPTIEGDKEIFTFTRSIGDKG